MYDRITRSSVPRSPRHVLQLYHGTCDMCMYACPTQMPPTHRKKGIGCAPPQLPLRPTYSCTIQHRQHRKEEVSLQAINQPPTPRIFCAFSDPSKLRHVMIMQRHIHAHWTSCTILLMHAHNVRMRDAGPWSAWSCTVMQRNIDKHTTLTQHCVGCRASVWRAAAAAARAEREK